MARTGSTAAASHWRRAGQPTQAGRCSCSMSSQRWLRGEVSSEHQGSRASGEVASAKVHEHGLDTWFSLLAQLKGWLGRFSKTC